MQFKKVVVASVDLRTFCEGVAYLGSIGGQITDKCMAIKGLILRAEVEVPWDTPVNESPTIQVNRKDIIERDVQGQPKDDKKPTQKRQSRGKVVDAKQEEEQPVEAVEASEDTEE